MWARLTRWPALHHCQLYKATVLIGRSASLSANLFADYAPFEFSHSG